MKQLFILLPLASLLLAACGGTPPPDTEATVQAAIAATQAAQPTDTPVPEPAAGQATPAQVTPPTAPATGQPSPSPAPSNIAQVWANEGGDKVTRDELRATDDPNAVLNSVWNGTGISLSGARNEVVSFNLVLEAPTTDVTDVNVTLTELTGPDGASITTRTASGDDVFNYVGRDIELFYVRYLEIRGLSVDLAYSSYDERHIPERCRRPYDEYGEGSGGWEDRPCHNKFYPEIAVPLELHSPFSIIAGTNQAIWGDIYIPHGTPVGDYSGTIAVTEDNVLTWEIPISLRVRDFTLPDLPSARTMVVYEFSNISDRYLGEAWPEPGTDIYAQANMIIDRHFQLAHRHKTSLISSGSYDASEYPPGSEYWVLLTNPWVPRLNSELFTPERGYDGIGVGVGNNVYSIGTYGGWFWQDGDEADMWANTDAWVNWFDERAFDTPTDYFLYLIDESDDYPQIEQWAQWADNNPGPGQRLMTMATIDIADAAEHTPSLDIAAFGSGFGMTDLYQAAADTYVNDPDKRFYVYNGSRPATGSFAIEDDGAALRMIGWAQFKMNVDRWFYWAANYYINYQCFGYDDPRAQTNVFQQAQTFGCYDYDDDSLGKAGWNYFNGDGVLFYPGTDTRYPEESYGVMGPFASLRLKHWRRGIQDMDYLTLAAKIDPERTAGIVNEMVPKVLWEYGVSDPEDPSWVRTDISWSTDPDMWEAARAKMADIIEGAASISQVSPSVATVDETPNATPTQPQGLPEVAGCTVFPAENVWNAPVDTLPVDANSDVYIATIGADKNVHPDFGSGTWEGGPIGIPYVDVPGTQPKVAVTFEYDDESDPGPYPIPPDVLIEGGPDSDGDRHVLVVDRDNCILYEMFYAFPQPDGSWHAGSGAIFDLNSNVLRPDSWTSADAAGLPILPGLVRYDEVAAGEIGHALRFTAPQTRRAYVWPARHYASSLTEAQYPPMGQRFRLRADFDISGFPPEVQVILRALKKYGMILADNGSAWYITGVPDERWDNDVLHELHQIKGSDFEAVDVSSLMMDPDSGQVRTSE